MGSVRDRCWCALALLSVTMGSRLCGQEPDFREEVRPILAQNCFPCHGPDGARRKAKLRLDSRDGPVSAGLIVPGEPERSELVRRLSDADPARRMPPPTSGRTLSEREKAVLVRWVAAGAKYPRHWSFEKADLPAVPAVTRADWPVNPIDNFVLAELEKKGWTPAAEAERPVLLRRLSLALTGLPPTPEEVDAFVADPRADAVERQVDRLLESPRFGEHFARHWLDVARYGDTHGLHIDNFRSIYPYRDWVIRAFQENMPYDRFLREQLAGDLLPGAELSQQIATGFLRCNVSTNECGTIEAEAEARNLQDRVDTFGQAMLGLTLGCAKCHDHKYDPVSIRDYYALAAFFNSIDGSAKDGNLAAPPPFVRLGTPEQLRRLGRLEAELSAIRDEIRETALRAVPAPAAATDDRLPFEDFVWFDRALPEGAKPLADGKRDATWEWVDAPKPLREGRKSVRLESAGTVRVAFGQARPALKVGSGDRLFVHVWIDSKNPPTSITLQWHSDSWRHAVRWGDAPAGVTSRGPLPASNAWVRLEVPIDEVGLREGDQVTGWALEQQGGRTFWNDFGLTTRTPQNPYQTYDTQAQWERAQTQIGLANTHLSDDLKEALKTAPADRTAERRRLAEEFFRIHGYRGNTELLAPLRARQAELRRQLETIERATATSLVFRERAEPKPAFVLVRGNYDHPGERVSRNVPAALRSFAAEAPRDRLGLANWLTDPRNPLAARIAANRFWQQLFGTGLVRTADDFGIRGESPSHPRLLDWLAATFVAEGWDVKKTVRRIVTSRTYRQGLRNAPEPAEQDPANRWLWRGPHFRLEAEVLRDQALFVGGLLVEKIGGPPVKPPQPAGLWEAVAIPGSDTGVFVADRGADKVYRRSIYTLWKRAAPPPQMILLDAPSRETCTVQRERTNTPLQALLLMNEETYFAAARGLAEKALRQSSSDEGRLTRMFRSVLARSPTERELGTLRRTLQDHRERFRAFPEEAAALAGGGEAAAWTMIGNLLLNLDETVAP
jgi:Protein of unknown function (DUF1553)/Protein of unknown function (DUF1549)/Planctomycete cytochrome C